MEHSVNIDQVTPSLLKIPIQSYPVPHVEDGTNDLVIEILGFDGTSFELKGPCRYDPPSGVVYLFGVYSRDQSSGPTVVSDLCTHSSRTSLRPRVVNSVVDGNVEKSIPGSRVSCLYLTGVTRDQYYFTNKILTYKTLSLVSSP